MPMNPESPLETSALLFAQVTEVVEDCVKFAEESPKPERGQLLENVFPDPRGFGIAADGRYRWGLQEWGGP